MNNYPTFEDLKFRAKDTNISKYEKIGFNDKLRSSEIELNIFNDIVTKCEIENKTNLKILDLGCGCSDLLYYFIDHCKKNKNELHLIDSEEMLGLCEDDFVKKHQGKFPFDFQKFIKDYESYFDIIICYSVIQHIYEDPNNNVYLFINNLVKLLSKNGKLFIGDIPNTLKQNRFISSDKGRKLHEQWNITPKKHNTLEENRMDDFFIINILSQYRNYMFETYLLKQPDILPMNYVRDDLLLIKY